MLGWSPQPLGRALPVGALLFVVPALAEELVFRAALVPRPSEPASAFRLAWPLAAFVLWHPLQAWTVGPPWSATFLQPWFLVAVAVLGATLTAVYRVTGSVWACAAVHWAAVAAWKLLLDGPF
jgi:predicted Abi (CAAX) family protease